MTQKERLVKLILNSPFPKDVLQYSKRSAIECDIYCSDIESFADYLLKNGVIVPPCRAGDFVYGIYPVANNTETIIRDWIFEVEAVDYESLHLIYRTEQFCFDEDSFGEYVFPTYEAAEQALKERGE